MILPEPVWRADFRLTKAAYSGVWPLYCKCVLLDTAFSWQGDVTSVLALSLEMHRDVNEPRNRSAQGGKSAVTCLESVLRCVSIHGLRNSHRAH